jgi:hypothetical protein
MARWLLAGSLAAILMGGGLTVPLAAAGAESRPATGAGFILLLAGALLTACGVAALLVGLCRRRGPAMPGGVRAAVAADILFLAFCALELSDRLVRQEGRVFYWTTLLFLPALLLFYGLLSARGWAWWTTRGLAAASCLWFLAFVAVIPFAELRGEEGPVPWYGRVYMACVSLAFAGVVAGAYRSLGGPEARRYFGVVRPAGSAAPEEGGH